MVSAMVVVVSVVGAAVAVVLVVASEVSVVGDVEESSVTAVEVDGLSIGDDPSSSPHAATTRATTAIESVRRSTTPSVAPHAPTRGSHRQRVGRPIAPG